MQLVTPDADDQINVLSKLKQARCCTFDYSRRLFDATRSLAASGDVASSTAPVVVPGRLVAMALENEIPEALVGAVEAVQVEEVVPAVAACVPAPSTPASRSCVIRTAGIANVAGAWQGGRRRTIDV